MDKVEQYEEEYTKAAQDASAATGMGEAVVAFCSNIKRFVNKTATTTYNCVIEASILSSKLYQSTLIGKG